MSRRPQVLRAQVTVPAKINLFLGVRGVRDDGYHELVTVFQSIGLTDVLTAEMSGPVEHMAHPAGGRRTELTFSHDAGPAVPDDARNLVVRAAELLAEVCDVDMTHVPVPTLSRAVRTSVHLAKRIPVAGGMAGGSADAAAALVALAAVWDLQLGRDALRALAAPLGADVPFTVIGGTALATGIGTGFVRVLCRGVFHWVVCTAPEELSTPQVFRAWDERCAPNEVQPDAVLAAVASGDAVALGAALHNDLQPAAEHLLPRLQEDRTALLDAGALGAVVSGSGPTLLALAGDEEHALEIADDVADRFASVHVTSSPSGGPTLSTGAVD